MEERGPYKAEVPGSIPGPPTTEIFGHFSGFSPTSYLDDRKRTERATFGRRMVSRMYDAPLRLVPHRFRSRAWLDVRLLRDPRNNDARGAKPRPGTKRERDESVQPPLPEHLRPSHRQRRQRRRRKGQRPRDQREGPRPRRRARQKRRARPAGNIPGSAGNVTASAVVLPQVAIESTLGTIAGKRERSNFAARTKKSPEFIGNFRFRILSESPRCRERLEIGGTQCTNW